MPKNNKGYVCGSKKSLSTPKKSSVKPKKTVDTPIKLRTYWLEVLDPYRILQLLCNPLLWGNWGSTIKHPYIAYKELWGAVSNLL